MAIATTLFCLAGTALAQSGPTFPDSKTDAALVKPPGPIVDGQHLQPTWSEILEREAIRHGGQPGAAPPSRNPDDTDKEIDELYNELLRESHPRE